MIWQDKRWLKQNINLLTKLYYSTNVIMALIHNTLQSHKDPTHEWSQIKHPNTPLANTPIQRFDLTITNSNTENKKTPNT
jgi:hypothetical protein